jgi:hypothetical protein
MNAGITIVPDYWWTLVLTVAMPPGVASTQDISLGGLYMNTQTEIPIGKTLALRIPLGGRHVVIKADVIYSNPGHGVGVRFHRLPDEAREIMERELPAP